MLGRHNANILRGWLVLLFGVVLLGCGGLEIKSAWRNREIAIDGIPTDWRGVSPIYVDAPNIAIRVLNDDDYLYLLLSSPDRNLAARMVLRGFTVWFDPDGGDEKTLGIRYPLSMGGPLMSKEDMRDRARIKQKIIETFQTSGYEAEVLGPGPDESKRLPTSGPHGIQVKIGYQSGNFVYELRMPLHPGEQHTYAIGGGADRVIGLGFEIPEPDMDEMTQAMGQDMPEGYGDRQEREGGKDREGNRGGGMSRGMHEPGGLEGLKIWTKLTLTATADSARPE